MGAPIRMSHPEHGFHHAYDGAELKRMKENGWEIEKPPVKAVPVVAPASAEPAAAAPKPKGRPKKIAA